MAAPSSTWLTRTVAHSGQIRQGRPSRIASSRSATARGIWQDGQTMRALKFWSMTVFLYSYFGSAILYADFIQECSIEARTERYALLQSVTCIGRSAPVSLDSCAVPQQPDGPPPSPSGRLRAPHSLPGAGLSLCGGAAQILFAVRPAKGYSFAGTQLNNAREHLPSRHFASPAHLAVISVSASCRHCRHAGAIVGKR